MNSTTLFVNKTNYKEYTEKYACTAHYRNRSKRRLLYKIFSNPKAIFRNLIIVMYPDGVRAFAAW